MSSTLVTLHDLFGFDRVPLAPEHLEALAGGEAQANIERHLGERASLAWSLVRRRVPECLRALLDVDAADIFIGAWNKSRELRKYRDPARYPPDQVILVPLARHKITSTHDPFLDVKVDGLDMGRVKFRVQIELTLHGAELKIKAGRILQIRTGRCDGTGTIACEGVVLGRIEGKVLTVPGTIDLGDGVALPA